MAELDDWRMAVNAQLTGLRGDVTKIREDVDDLQSDGKKYLDVMADIRVQVASVQTLTTEHVNSAKEAQRDARAEQLRLSAAVNTLSELMAKIQGGISVAGNTILTIVLVVSGTMLVALGKNEIGLALIAGSGAVHGASYIKKGKTK